MPQLSIETFVSQYFWLFIVFFGFLYVSSIYLLPTISKIMKIRNLIGKEETSTNSVVENKGKNLLNEYKC